MNNDKIISEQRICSNCKFNYSCGYTGMLSNDHECCEGDSFKLANGLFWSLIQQKEVSEEQAKRDWEEYHK